VGAIIFVTVSTGHFDPLIQACEDLSFKFDFFGQVGSGTVVPTFPHVKRMTPTELSENMANAELVISHAGTGMLSQLYRLKKPAIVIPKQIRYGEANDGQVELALKWAELKMAVLCLDVNELEAKIQEAKTFAFQWPTLPSLGAYLSGKLAERKPIDYVLGDGQEPTTL
jgi:UDP-N-acetylglucosamine transferase subunit ALG13